MSLNGPIGLALPPLVGRAPGETPGGDAIASAVEAAVEAEELGYGTVWVPGGQGGTLPAIAPIVRATRGIAVATGILSVDRVPAREVAAAYADLEATHPDRFVVGLGGAHGRRPLDTLGAYLDDLDSVPPLVPAPARVLSALGPRMLRLARERAAGAYPYLVTPAYAARARRALGPDRTLAVLLTVVPDADPARARQTARGPLRFLTTVPGYANNFRRMGFSDEEVSSIGDRLVDAVVAWGDPDRIVARVQEYRAAGVDQVVLQVSPSRPDEPVRVWWRRLAESLLP